ncbi:MAG: T9SS type A sorting domain-containing protein [Ferruginibacter sp.]
MTHKSNSYFKSTRIGFLKNVFLFFALLSFGMASEAKNYYFSSSTGNDSYSTTQAQSQATPWKSISKLNSIFSTLVAGDIVYFKRGDTFYGSIVVNKSGSSGKPITITAYGTGARPIISGFTTLSSWSSVGNGVYKATASGISSSLNMVTLNKLPQHLGRYPNLNASNGGYLNYESSGTTTITDNELTSTTNWTGAELVVRKAKHVMERWPITGHSGTKITYQPGTSAYHTAYAGYGYFIQKDIRCLDQVGEWFYNTSTKDMNMYFGTAGPSSSSVKVSTTDILMNISRYSFISVSELSFEGANTYAINIGSTTTTSSNVTVSYCDINYSGKDAVYATNADYTNVNNCNIDNSFNNSIEIENEGGTSTFASIRYNNINNSGSKPGMGASYGHSHQAITSYCNDAVIEYNTVDSTGYIAISFYFNNAKIRNNYITNFSFVKDDGGGIYTWTGPVGGPVYYGREIKNNILLNAIGAAYGTPSIQNTASGIYMDDGVVGVTISGNTVANSALAGIYIHNTHEISITNNTLYNCAEQVLFVHDNITPTDPIRNVVLKNNTMVAKSALQLCFNMRTIKDDINQTGPTDSNYYSRPVDDGIAIGALSSVLKTSYSLEGWKTKYAKDSKSKKSPKSVLLYKINSLLTSNLLSNGDYASNISGMTFWSQNSNHSAAWDGTGKISGGSLRLSFPVSTPNVYTMCIKSIGAISSSKKYIVRFSTLGTSEFGMVRAFLRKTASPNTVLATAQVRSFGTTKKDHEFHFTPSASDAGASLVFEIQQNSGTTYVDNVQFMEATTSPASIDEQLRFEYNASASAKTISLGANYVAIDGTAYNGSITLQPFSSKVLITEAGAVYKPPTTPTTLLAAASVPAISCFGSGTSVAVSGSGGTAPYTGTGAYTAYAGKSTLKLAMPSGSKSVYTLLYAPIGILSSAKTYILRFSTLGTTSNGSLRASLRKTNTPWSVITAVQSKTYSTSRVDHEYKFTAPANEPDASFLIEVLQSSGTTYIDNIAFFEANSAGSLIGYNTYGNGQFESGLGDITVWSPNGNHQATVDQTSKITNTHYFSVKDADGAISTATAKTAQPAAALVANATGGLITWIGGVTTVVVSATGGTPPYTGTGSFSNVRTGTYTYTIRDSKGCSVITSLTLTLGSAKIAGSGVGSINSRVSEVTDENKTLSVNCFPNPTTTEFSLMVTGGSNELVNVSVLSMDGRVVYKAQGTSNKRYTFGNTLNSGMYIIQVIQGKTMQTIKAVKGL